jgi:hypothetical protein
MTEQTLAHRLIAVQPNWEDVIARAARARKTRRTGLALAAAAILLLGAAPALGVGGWLSGIVHGRSVPTSRLTPFEIRQLASRLEHAGPARLARVTTPAQRARTLRQLGLVELRLVGTRRKLAFYVVDLRHGQHCYATGRAPMKLFFSVVCPAGANAFPSTAAPVLDESIVDQRGNVLELAGLAATGVASVGLADASGVFARASVRGNVFAADVPLRPSSALVAFDNKGRAVWCSAPNRACGTARKAVATRHGGLRIYFAHYATMRQISRAIAAIRGEPGVMRVSFVSKEASFALMKKRYPHLVKNLTFNPLPDSLSVKTSPRADDRTIFKRLRARHLSGVDAIRY